MEYKQTAVEWFLNQIVELIPFEVDTQTAIRLYNVYNPAEEMEKEKIIDAHIEGQRVFDKHPHTQWTNDQAEQYYNETYGKNKI